MFVVFTLSNRVQPMDRGELFEDPLGEWLEESELGEVVGGGTMLGEDGEIAHCDVELELTDPEQLDAVVGVLEELGAAKGSSYRVEGDDEAHPFGQAEGLALYLNGSELPDEVYEQHGAQEVYDALCELVQEIGEVQGHWQGPSETALYLYGVSFEALRGAIAEFVASHPLCQKSRIERIA